MRSGQSRRGGWRRRDGGRGRWAESKWRGWRDGRGGRNIGRGRGERAGGKESFAARTLALNHQPPVAVVEGVDVLAVRAVGDLHGDSSRANLPGEQDQH